MNEPYNVNEDQARIDRLVDGELSQSEYRTLLASMDDEPGGWRACALAFLEAQALRQDLAALSEEPEPAQPTPVPDLPRAASKAKKTSLAVLAVAASFLLAFGLGLWVKDLFQPPVDSPLENNVAIQPDKSQDSPSRQPVGPAFQTTPEPQLADRPLGDDVRSLVRPVANMTFTVDDDQGGQSEYDLPVYHIDQVGPQWLSEESSAVPQPFIDAVRRRGGELRRSHRLVPFTLEDGQQVVVPVEEVEIVPVGLPF